MKLSNVKEQILADVSAIRPCDDLEAAHQADTLRWIESDVAIFRVEKPDTPAKHLVAYFVLVDPEHQSLLLGNHIKAQLWLPSGGHVELNELPVATVVREAKEELEIDATFLRGRQTPFFVTVTQTVGLTAGHTDVSLWYLLRGSVHQHLTFDRSEFTDMAWFTFDEIQQSHPAILDPHMQRFTSKLAVFLTR